MGNEKLYDDILRVMVPRWLYAALKQAAKDKSMSMSAFVRTLLAEALAPGQD